jgi:fatty acyl-CoA reductase
VTGFIGKCLLFKLLKEFPDIGSIGILVRAKKGVSPEDRLDKQVFAAACFDPLRKELGDAEFARRVGKCYGIVGDMMEHNLGINDENYAELTSKLNFVVHLAATIDFQEKLNISVKMNVLGTLRVMAIAHKSPNIESVIHVSTCYVNYNRRNTPLIEEKLYPLGFDAESMCKYILSLTDSQMPAETAKLLKKYGYANTYTFTKSMTEHILMNRKGTLPLTIVRPAIVGCAWKEPLPGWVDVLTAAGGIFLMIGLGMIREGISKEDNIADLVPVDFVCNTIIKAQYKTCIAHLSRLKPQLIVAANLGSGGVAITEANHKLLPTTAVLGSAGTVGSESARGSEDIADVPALPFVFHSGTSTSLNTFTWGLACAALGEYWNAHPHARAMPGRSGCEIYTSRTAYKFKQLTSRQLPVAAMRVVARLPIVGSAKKVKAADKMHRGLNKVASVFTHFDPFLTNVWRFDTSNCHRHLDDPALAASFPSDPYDVNWDTYVKLYSYGIVTWIMKTKDGRSQPIQHQTGANAFLKAAL